VALGACLLNPICAGILLGVGIAAALLWLSTASRVQDRTQSNDGPCPTNDDPSDYLPFLDGDDILCNLRRYGGSYSPYGIATYEALRFYGHDVQVLTGRSFVTFGASGRYSPPDPVFPDGMTNPSGGIIYLNPPDAVYLSGTRADRMATLAEELYHAAQFFGVVGSAGCNTALLPGEFAAKTAKLGWILTSKIDVTKFAHTAELDFQGSLDSYIFALYSSLGDPYTTPLFRNAQTGQPATCFTGTPPLLPSSTGYNMLVDSCGIPLIVRQLVRV
jgi:hypothetical protein